ncbi:MAG: hypothetical protein KGI50_05645 [Patescibacteria group bacterium]|nr:hypothetical protein [Patescibacteria group bacterium]MDE2438885.1 hypothetical protein [Patescibacteria group bacterium]
MKLKDIITIDEYTLKDGSVEILGIINLAKHIKIDKNNLQYLGKYKEELVNEFRRYLEDLL